MNPATVIQALVALATLTSQLTPLVLQLKTAIEAKDETQVEDLLRRLQAVNDQLGSR